VGFQTENAPESQTQRRVRKTADLRLITSAISNFTAVRGKVREVCVSI
jgi:hypothetical protein